jgi:hypothetical protein
MSQVKVAVEFESDDLVFITDELNFQSQDLSLDYTVSREESGGVVKVEIVGDSQEALELLDRVDEFNPKFEAEVLQ